MNGPIGAGVKQTISINRAKNAIASRPDPKRCSSFKVGGWCGPSRTIITVINTVQRIQLAEKKLMLMATPSMSMVTIVERRAKHRERDVTAIELSNRKQVYAVASKPNHAANAIGCRFNE